MRNEKPGGHGERSVAVGTIDMAVWDAVAKIAGKPLFRLLAERHGLAGRSARLRLCRRRLLLPRQGPRRTARGDAQLSRPRLHRGQDEDRRRRARRRPAAHRGCARGDRHAGRPGRRCERALRSRDRDRLREDAARVSALLVRGGRAIRSTTRCRPRSRTSIPAPWLPAKISSATRTRAICCVTAACAPTATGCSSTAPCPTACASTCAPSTCVRRAGWSPRRCIPHGGHQMSLNIAAGLGLGGNESYPDLFQPYGGFPDGVRVESGYISMPELARHRLRRQERPDPRHAPISQLSHGKNRPPAR